MILKLVHAALQLHMLSQVQEVDETLFEIEQTDDSSTTTDALMVPMSTPISTAELSHTNLSRILIAACNQLNGHEGKTVWDGKTLVHAIPSLSYFPLYIVKHTGFAWLLKWWWSSAFDAIKDLGAGHLAKKQQICQDRFFTDLISTRGLGVRGWPSGKTEMLRSVVALPE